MPLSENYTPQETPLIQEETRGHLQHLRDYFKYTSFQRQYLFEDPDYSVLGLKKKFQEDPSGDFQAIGKGKFTTFGQPYNGINSLRNVMKNLTDEPDALSKQEIFEATGVDDAYMNNLEKNVYFFKMKPTIKKIHQDLEKVTASEILHFDVQIDDLLRLTNKDEIFAHIGITEEEYNKIYIDTLIDKNVSGSLVEIKKFIMTKGPRIYTIGLIQNNLKYLKERGISKQEAYKRSGLTDEWIEKALVEATLVSDPSFSILAYLKKIKKIEGTDDTINNPKKQKKGFASYKELIASKITQYTLKDTDIPEEKRRALEKDIAEYEEFIASDIGTLHEQGIKDTYISQKTGLSQAKIDELLQKYPKKEEKKNS